ncbi:MAG: hypothetical protein AB1798_24135, partial [Spirochaetota bacterium]
IAFGFLIALESLILNFLSLFNAVTRRWVFISHAVLIALWLIWAVFFKLEFTTRIFQRFNHSILIFWRNPLYRLILPLLLLLTFTAIIFPPNNYDSMVYHMSRIAHWIQNKSIEYYPTAIDRQNVMGPGAEYLVLFFQILTGDDYLANCVQLFSFCILGLSLGYLLRAVGVPKKIYPPLVILAFSTPVAILHATTTKNDVVATAITFAIIISLLRFITINNRQIRIPDYAFIGISAGCGFLVKPTTLLVTAPFIISAAIYELYKIFHIRTEIKIRATGWFVAFVLFLLVSGPDIIRKQAYGVKRHEVYPLLSEWTMDRLWNPLKTLAQNFPFPKEYEKLLRKAGYNGVLYTKNIFNPHEDFIGNPFQTLLFTILTLLSIVMLPLLVIKKYHSRYVMISLSPLAAWIIFSLFVRDQGWITRLQTPLFFMISLSFLFILTITKQRKFLFKLVTFSITILSICSLSFSTVIAVQNKVRPLMAEHFWANLPNRNEAYYNNGGDKKSHDFLLLKAEELNCTKVGFVAGPDSYDYPLTWRGITKGIQFKHIRKAET